MSSTTTSTALSPSHSTATSALRAYYTKHFLAVSKSLFPSDPTRWGPLPWEPAARSDVDASLFAPTSFTSNSASASNATSSRASARGGGHGDGGAELDALRRRVLGPGKRAAGDAGPDKNGAREPAYKRRAVARGLDSDEEDEEMGRAAAVSKRAERRKGRDGAALGAATAKAKAELKSKVQTKTQMQAKTQTQAQPPADKARNPAASPGPIAADDHVDSAAQMEDDPDAGAEETAASKAMPTDEEVAERKRLRKQRKRAARKRKKNDERAAATASGGEGGSSE